MLPPTAVHRRRNNSLFIALTTIGLACALYLLLTWIVVSNRYPNASQEQLVQVYYTHLPSFLKPGHRDAYVMLLSSVLAVVAASVWTKRSIRLEKVMAIVLLVIASLLLAMSLFQMM